MLEKLIKNQVARFFMFFCMVLYASTSVAQENILKGVVKDAATGDVLTGGTVAIQGAASSTQTDADGGFTIAAQPGQILVFSFVGYERKSLKVGSSKTLDVQLSPSDNILEELVVVGYGSQKRSDITGSVASVPKERLSKLPVSNVTQAIQGAVANVNINQISSIPGDAPTTQVRGLNSMSANSGPYIVVDGIPLSKSDGSINDINPNDIESVEILKDPSAVAIYGVNGSNGVILITTKRGASGTPHIRYSGYSGIEEPSHMLEPVSAEELLNRYAEYARITNTSLFNGGPVRNEYEWDNFQNGITTDWLDAVMQTGSIQNHNVSLSGGSENAKYYISVDYLGQKGIVKGFDYKRYSFRANTDFDPTGYLKVGTSAFIAAHNRDGGRANLTQALAMSPYARMYEEDGTLDTLPDVFRAVVGKSPSAHNYKSRTTGV